MSPSAKVIDANGAVTGERDLPAALFGGAIHHGILHQVVVAQRDAERSGSASTKTRSEVRGGGAKPWRQKGTGRARHGSSRSPLWAGGGTVFGPKPRKYRLRVNKKVRKAALRSALADKAAAGAVWVLDGFSEPRTKAAARTLDTAEIGGRLLIVLDGRGEDEHLVDRAFRNLPRVAFSLATSLAAYDILVADALIFTRSAFDSFTGEEAPT
ncbi:50S ribosomal protein L4 [soil metagenome]